MLQRNSSTHSSVEKALEILMAFAPYNQEMGTIELSKKLGLHASTVSRLLKVLTTKGFIQHNPRTKKFRLGKSTADLGRAITQSLGDHLVIIAQPYLDELRDSLGTIIALEVLAGKSTVLAYRTGEPKRVGVQFPIGGRLPVHIAAGARAIMAFSSPDLVDYMLEGELTPWTPKTITDRAVLKKNLGEYRRHGVAFDLGETDIDSYFIAAPIFDHTKKPVAAIILGDLARKINGRFSPKLISAIKQTAAKISAQLLYSEDET